MCYQLPALILPNLTLVISPLLALMKDQLEFLHSKGIAAASIDSSQDKETTNRTMQQVRNGDIKVLMISVERLKNERFRQFISQVPISMLVVDEAHCISEWGIISVLIISSSFLLPKFEYSAGIVINGNGNTSCHSRHEPKI